LNLISVLAARRQHLREGVSATPAATDHALTELEKDIRAELQEATAAVDFELEEGRGKRCLVAAVRATPQTPEDVVEYTSDVEFLEEDPRRGRWREDGSADLGGADWGMRWSLEDSFDRWRTTRWRISWLCEVNRFMLSDESTIHSDRGEATTEIYALEFIDDWRRTRTGRVWMLGKLATSGAVQRALDELIAYAIHERNSLVVAAQEVSRVMRDEEWKRSLREPEDAAPGP
jgi:hypothetical protein